MRERFFLNRIAGVREMVLEQGKGVGQTAVRALTKQEIDRRIQQLTSQLAARAEEPISGSRSPDVLHPRWIAPAELVRRLRHFVVYN